MEKATGLVERAERGDIELEKSDQNSKISIQDLVEELASMADYDLEHSEHEVGIHQRAMENLLTQCVLPDVSEIEDLMNKAEEKFAKALKASLERSSPKRTVKTAFVRRLKDRFLSVLRFLLNLDRSNCEGLTVRCYDMAKIFGPGKVNDFYGLVSHTTQIVKQVEDKCNVKMFSTYFMTLSGKSTRILPDQFHD